MITLSLLARILLDAELNNRRAFVDNTFSESVGYLSQYIKANQTDLSTENQARLKPLLEGLEQMLSFEKQLNTWNRLVNANASYKKSDLSPIADALIELSSEKKYFLPGGWKNCDNKSHQMLYQFEKTTDALRFLIFNSGGEGLNEHDQQSSIHGERYFPVKGFDIPNPLQSKKLQDLLDQLTVANLPRHRSSEQDYNTTLLYQKIRQQLDFLQAKPVPTKELTSFDRTTAGAISKTSVQRSIHQLLKINFDTLENYQEFMLGFKYHTLIEFMKSNPQTHHAEINELILAGIKNILRLLQVVAQRNPDIIHSFLPHLTTIKESLQVQEVQREPQRPQDDQADKYQLTPWRLSPSQFHPLTPPTNIKRAPLQPSFSAWQLDLTQPLLSQIEALLSLCQQREKEAPLWVIEQIEQTLVSLPVTEPKHAIFAPIEDKETVDQMKSYIDELQSLYTAAVRSQLGYQQRAQSLLTLWQFIAWYDCIDLRQEKLLAFHSVLIYFLRNVFKGMRYSPYLATHSHQWDTALKALQTYYQPDLSGYSRFCYNTRVYFEHLLNNNNPFKKWLEEQYQLEYGSLSSDEHEAIRDHNETALYFLFKQFNSLGQLLEDSVLHDYSAAQPFIACIDEQLRFEMFLIKCFQPMLTRYTYEPGFSLTGSRRYYSSSNQQDFVVQFSSPAYDLIEYGGYYLSDSFGLMKSQYDLPPSPAAETLKHDHPKSISSTLYPYTANKIQLRAADLKDQHAQRAINKEDFFHRDLGHLRLSKKHQVSLTLEFFIVHIEYLKERSIQLYLTANLFEPGLLSNTLDNRPDILTLIETLVQKGLNYYRHIDGLLSQESLYFLQLQGDIYRYLASAERADRAQLGQQKLQLFVETLSRTIDLNSNEAILASLHQMRLLNGMALKKHLSDTAQEAWYETLFISHFYSQAKGNPHYPLDKIAQYEQKKNLVALNHWSLQQPQQRLQDCVKKAIEPLHLFTNAQLNSIQGEYPHYRVQDNETTLYQINAEKGLIYKNQLFYGAVPLELQIHPLIQLLGLGEHTSCFISANGDLFELGTAPHAVRIQREDGEWIIQKQWTLAGQTEWYELQPLNFVHQQLFYSRNSYYYKKVSNIYSMLPDTLKDARSWLWTHPEEIGSFIAQKNIPVYRLQANRTLVALDEQQQPTGEILSPSYDVEQQLAVFEKREFMQINIAPNGQGHVDLPRYGLTFNLNSSSILSLPKTTFHLCQPKKPLFKSNVASLFFVDNEGYQQCLVPVQKFYEDKRERPSEDGHYLVLQHDIHSRLHANDHLMSYDHSEKAIAYRVIANKPQADKAADALYLCYIYLATNDYQKAWDVLNDLSLRLSFDGNPEELLYLSWIILMQDIQSASPRQNACQLKALALYTDFLSQDKQPRLEDPEACDLSLFYQSLPSIIEQLYSQHFKITRHLDVSYQLNDNECQTLLDFHFNHKPNPPHVLLYASLNKANETNLKNGYVWDGEKLFYISPDKTIQPLPIDDIEAFKALLITFNILPDKSYMLNEAKVFGLITQHTHHVPQNQPKAFGAIGYEWRRLSLKTLRREYENLTHSIAVATQQHQTVPSAMCERQQAIEVQLEKLEPIMGTQTELELVPINLSLKPINNEYWHYNLFQNNKAVCSDEEIAEHLTPDLSVHEIGTYFAQLCSIAQNPVAPLHQDLKLFCKTYLITHAHNPKKEQTAFAYVNLLYHLVENPSVRLNTRWGYGLSILFDALADTVVPPLYAYQTKNVYQHELAQTQQLWTSLAQEMPTPIAMHIKPVETMTMVDVLTHAAASSNNIAVFRQQFEQAETLYQTERLKCLKDNDEVGAGQIKYACLEKQRQLAEAFLADKHVRQQLQQTVQQIQAQLKQEAISHWQEALQKANQTHHDDDALKLSSGLKEPITKEKLLACYLQANEVTYLNTTALDSEACQALHQLIHQCVTTDVHYQHMTRLLEALAAIDDNPLHNTQLENVAQILMSKNLPKAENDPAIMLFQQQENILLRDRQLDALKNLLTHDADDPHQFHQAIEKVIMGGGKSKVIIPLLTQLKATGTNLVIVEVPRALLATNHTDLNFTSQKLFNQKAHRFEFDRNSDCSPMRLQAIYQRFIRILTNKDYLVTTGEAMQSLELKYLELLLNQPTNSQERIDWEQQVYWAGKITQLIKQNGDAVIDEVHKGLWRTQKLNYTLGTEQTISNESARHTVALYQFLDLIAEDIHGSIAEGESFKQRMTYEWPECFPVLVEQLLTHRSSPIAQAIRLLSARYGHEKTIDALRAYFNEQAISPIITTANKSMQDLFAFYKEQTHLLPRTLSRHYKEHYGPSKSPDLSLLSRAIAIPYVANDKPKERSRFGNTLETMNYTAQGLFLEGLTENLLVEIIQQWQIEARYEFQKQPDVYQNLSQTPTAVGVDMLYLSKLGLNLAHVNPQNEAQIAQIYNHLKHNKTLICEILRERILPQVTNEPAILHSDAYNHVSMYRSAQGLSGTPWNHATYHQDLKFNHHTSLGTDGYIQTVLSKNKTPVHGLDFDNLEQYLPRLFQKVQDPSKVHAIMDISASFEGLNNFTVATALTDYMASNRPDIKYVLYFNDQDVLCALSTEKPHQSITIGSSNPDDIRRKLNCGPENYFTYYDQAHTLGIDIQQALGSTGLCLVNEKTCLQHLLQGVMRMRDVGKTQQIEIFCPMAMTPTSVDALMQLMLRNQTEQLQQDVANSIPEKIENLLRNDLLKRIYALPPDHCALRHRYAKAFESFFVEIQKTQLFEQYGALYSEQPAAELFERDKNALLTAWENCLAQLNLPANRLEMEQQMQQIIINDLPHCKPTILTQANVTQQDREVEKQQEVAKQIDTAVELEIYNPDLIEVKYKNWDTNKLTQLLQGKMVCGHVEENDTDRFLAESNITITPINDVLSTHTSTAMESVLLSPQIMVSNNYKEVYQGQTHMLCGYLKPVYVIMYYKIGDKLFACIITNEEAQEITTLLQANLPHPPIWLCTTQNHVLAGHTAETLLNDPDYPLLNEQLRFFGGKALELVEDEQAFTWLNTDTVKKLQFFERHIMPYRDTKPAQYRQLQLAFSKKTEGFDYIAAHAFDDLSQIEWLDIIPDAFPSDVSACYMLAKAFDYANETYQSSELDLKQLHHKFSLVPAAVMYLKKHLAYLNTVKTILEKIVATEPTDDYLSSITAEEKAFLQQLLHIEFTSFGENKTTVKKNFDLLRLIKISPVIRQHSALTDVIKKTVVLQNIEDLRDLAKQKNLLDSDIECISLHPAADKSFIHLLINKATSAATLFNLINHPSIDESHLYRLFFIDHLADLRSDPIRHDIIVHPKTTTRLLSRILNQTPLPEAQLQSMLDKKELPASFLIQIIDKATDAATLKKAIQHPNATMGLFDKMLAHPLFTTQLGDSILAEIEDTPNNAKMINAMLMHSRAVESWWLQTLQRSELHAHHTVAFETYMQTSTVSLSPNERLSKIVMLTENVPAVDKADTLDVAEAQDDKTVARQHSDVLFSHILKSLAQESDQERLLSSLLIQNKDHHARLQNILTDLTLNETQLKSILQNAQQPLSAEILNLLLDKTADVTLVSDVLHYLRSAIPETTSSAVYHHLLTETAWNRQRQTLWHVLEAVRTAQNPPAFNDLWHMFMNQPPHFFNPMEASRFLNDCTLTFESLPIQEDDLIKARVAMQKLRVKAMQFCNRDDTLDGRYSSAAQASFELYMLLYNIARNHAKNPGSRASLMDQIQQVVAHYEPELKQHRGFKQLLIDILCFLPNLILHACQGFKGNFRFFKVNTQSGEIIDELKTSFKPQPGK